MTWEIVENTNFWEKEAIFPVKKTYLSNISRIVGHDKTQGTIYKHQ